MYVSFGSTGKTYCYSDNSGSWSTVVTGSGYLCPDCGKQRWQQWAPITAVGLCECNKLEKPKQYGWVCPVCGKGKSPWSTECKH